MATSGANKSSPYKYTSANHERFSQHSEVAQGQKENLGKDMNGNFRGPVEPDAFINDLMPVDLDVKPEFAERSKDMEIQFTLPVRKTRNSNLESKLYEVFNTSVKKYGLSPSFKFHISADGKPKLGDIQYRPDGGFEELPRYKPPTVTQPHRYNTRGKKQNLSIDDPEEDQEKTTDDDRREFDWCSDGLVVEFKRAGYMDPFLTRSQIKKAIASGKVTDSQGDSFTSFEKSKDEYVVTRGQLTMYATEIFAHQHRTHLFQLLICGRRARFLYWDHSGAVVSHSFKYTKHPNTLARFLWRYNHMEASARGLDRTATVATDEESLRFHNVVEQLLKDMNDPQTSQRRLPHAADTLSGAYHVYKLTVFDDVTSNKMDVLVRKPFFSHRSAIGRGTRGYLAYPLTLDSEELKFLKDTWRVMHPRLTPEREVVRKLQEAQVPCLPEILCGGDVPNSHGTRVTTRASDYTADQVKSEIGFADPRAFCQHRLLEEITYPPESAANSNEFILILLDVFMAIATAYNKCGTLHRDISVGNIMIKFGEAVCGVLADWDHSATAEPDSENQNYRTGTWQFMSIGLCEDPKKAHDVLDDYESGFWVLLYVAVHHFKLKPNGDGEREAPMDINLRLFDDSDDKKLPDGKIYKVGGAHKRAALKQLKVKGPNFASARLNELISYIAGQWDELYSLKENLIAKAAATKRNASTTSTAASQRRARFDYDAVFRGCKDQLKEDPHEQGLAELKERLDTKKANMSNPYFWANLFEGATAEEGWDMSDILPTDRFPRISKKEAAQQVYEDVQSSHMTGGDMAARDANQRAYTNQLRQQPLQKVQVPPEQDEFDRDDASCICLEDEEGREDPDSDSDFDSDSDSDDKLPSLPTTRTHTSSTRFPPTPAPHSSMFSVSSWRSGTSSKRALSEDESSDSDSEDSVKDAQPLKKRKALVPGKPEFEAGSSAVASSVHRMSLGGATESKKALQKGKGKERVEEHKEGDKTAKTSKEARPTKALAKLRPRRTTGKADGEGSNGAN